MFLFSLQKSSKMHADSLPEPKYMKFQMKISPSSRGVRSWSDMFLEAMNLYFQVSWMLVWNSMWISYELWDNNLWLAAVPARWLYARNCSEVVSNSTWILRKLRKFESTNPQLYKTSKIIRIDQVVTEKGEIKNPCSGTDFRRFFGD